jgi:DNA-binding NarL/FixJ family response regulator
MIKRRVLLVDDQSLFREALRTLLSIEPDVEIVGEAANGGECLVLASRCQPDVVLMDLRMPGMDGVEATRQLTAAQFAGKVIVLTTFDEDEMVFDALRAGAKGYLLKACSAGALCDAIRRVARGESILDPAVTAKVVGEFNRMSGLDGHAPTQRLADPLSVRELEVLRLLAGGCSNKEIGARLHIAGAR